jgi:hypothetical protein
MSYKDHLDQQSQRFHYTWTSPKHTKSQINGQTKLTQSNIWLRRTAKANRW